jgi:hypothetical protein
MPARTRRIYAVGKLALAALLSATLGLAGCQQNGMGMGGSEEGGVSPIAGTLGGAGLGALAGRLIAGSHGNSAAMLGGALIGGLGGLLGTTMYNRRESEQQQLSTTKAALAQQEQINQQLHAQQLYSGWAETHGGTAPPINSPRDVQAAQGLLAGLGFYRGPVDGQFGPMTRDAVLSFQNSRGLQPTGVVTPALVQQLRGAI